MVPEEPPAPALSALHAAVDARAADLARVHGGRLRCRRGCAGCCVDGISVFSIEAERIQREAAGLLAQGSPHPPGACAFLDAEGACRIYAQRPYVCRTQGLPLRWLDEARAGGPVELRDLCPLNDEGGPALEELPAAECWTIGPVEAALRALQRRATGDLRRVALRDLFARREARPETGPEAPTPTPPRPGGRP